MFLILKRLIDIVVALSCLALGWPVLLLTAIAVRYALGSPVLFKQQRVGKNDRIFVLYKFRSMCDASDKNGHSLNDAQRLSTFGKILRSTSLDELPELWNILKGDMSLIGPRPLLPEYLPYYSPTERQRHTMRPGLTGLAQINGRNAINWDKRLAYDVSYVQNWNLWLDLKIIFGTITVVFSRKGISADGEATVSRFDDYARATRNNDVATDRIQS